MKIFLFILLTTIYATGSLADQPKQWQFGFQDAASQSMRDIVSFHNNLLLPVIIAISVFVLFLMIYTCIRFRASQDTIPKVDLTIKAVGYQWYWGYEYPDENIIFESYMIKEEELKENQPRLLTVDNELVVPVNKVVKVLITANDVLHAWALPSFGVKRDAVPGRINETWFKAEKVGTYYGQCSELCGIQHAFMPITVRVVTDEEYAEWLAEAKMKFAKEPITENEYKKLASK
jgi:cytochrome c oxidase subunit 2